MPRKRRSLISVPMICATALVIAWQRLFLFTDLLRLWDMIRWIRQCSIFAEQSKTYSKMWRKSHGYKNKRSAQAFTQENGKANMENSVSIFISYAHEDISLLRELEKHLSQLKWQKLIDVWHDRDIDAGTEWEQEIDTHLNTAQIILLLISPDFMASKYCYSVEMQRAMERHQSGSAHVIPIILRPVYWEEALFSRLQALPTNALPIVSHKWHTRDDAFVDIVRGIRKTVEEALREKTREQKQKHQQSEEPSSNLKTESYIGKRIGKYSILKELGSGGRTPLTGGRDQSQLARSSSRSFRQGWISHWVFTRTTSQLWWNPWRGSHSIAEQLEDAPHVICQPCRHRWCAGMSCMFRFAQFMMRKAKIVRRANQVHPGF